MPVQSPSENELYIPSNPKLLAYVRKYVRRVASSYGFGEKEIFDLQVAASEAASNAIEHGIGKTFKLSFCKSGESLLITVTNLGPFKKKIPAPDNEEYRGRGILLMLALVDHVEIDELPNQVKVTLSKKLPKNLPS
jgi:serine/threonine-protein kinase RsbW